MKVFAKMLVFLVPRLLVSIGELYDRFISFLFPRYRLITRDVLTSNIENDIARISKADDPEFNFILHTPNRLCAYRADTFWTKEPEILEWISEFGGEDSVFFDVGANIGLYSIYYAKMFSAPTYSFEPSAFNLKQLAKNIDINNLTAEVVIVPVPLNECDGVSVFCNGSNQEGGALNAFGVEHGHDGLPLSVETRYSVVGFSMDTLIDAGVISQEPALIKIDVDGIEHLILKGAKNTLSSSSLKSIFIEVNDNFFEQSYSVQKCLTDAGFVLREKRQSELLEDSIEFGRTFNQIWVRP